MIEDDYMEKYTVTLTREEREMLLQITKKGNHKSRKIRNALILLNCDAGEYSMKYTNKTICYVLQIGIWMNHQNS